LRLGSFAREILIDSFVQEAGEGGNEGFFSRKGAETQREKGF
jgi:hypothetical protein